MNQKLQKHYEQKYSAESGSTGVEIVPVVNWPTNRYQAAVKHIPTRFHGGDVLELGAGNGNVAASLLKMLPGIRSYTLGDISMPRVEGIRRNLDDDRVKVRHLDAEAIGPEMAGQFDLVIMIALIEHLIDPMGAMANIRNLLKGGGLVYLDTPNIAKYTRRLALLLGRFPSTATTNEGLTTYEGRPVDLHEEGHLHYVTFRSLSLMLTERCGFSRVEKIGYPAGRLLLGRRIECRLARCWPEMFSELALVAYA